MPHGCAETINQHNRILPGKYSANSPQAFQHQIVATDFQKRANPDGQNRKKAINPHRIFHRSRTDQYRFRRIGQNPSHHRHNGGNGQLRRFQRRSIRGSTDDAGNGNISGKNVENRFQCPGHQGFYIILKPLQNFCTNCRTANPKDQIKINHRCQETGYQCTQYGTEQCSGGIDSSRTSNTPLSSQRSRHHRKQEFSIGADPGHHIQSQIQHRVG